MQKSNFKMIIFGVALLVILSLAIFTSFSFNKNNKKSPAIFPKKTSFSSSSSTASGSDMPISNSSSSVYTVQEIKNMPASKFKQLKGKEILLKGYIVDAVRGLGCTDYVILTDYKYVNSYLKAIKEGSFLGRFAVPVLLAKIEVDYENNKFYPTTYAIYKGHFFDSRWTKKCPNLSKAFFIDGKVKELVPARPKIHLEKTLNSGCVIINGRLLLPPLKVSYNGEKVFVNNISYSPLATEKYQGVTINTFARRKDDFNSLVKVLKKGRLVIKGGNIYGETLSQCDKEALREVGKICSSSFSRADKVKMIKKILGCSTNAANDILNTGCASFVF